MKKSLLYYFCFLWIAAVPVAGQPILFSHLDASDGLTDNFARAVSIDNNGFLWIGTSNGLNVYDGYGITTYTREQQPGLASDAVLHIYCDNRNRVWLGTNEGATWLDASRCFHRVTIRDTVQKFFCHSIYETATYGIVLFTNKGQFYFDSTAGQWQELNWIPDLIGKATFLDAEPLNADKVIFTTDSMVAILDYATRQVIYHQRFHLPVSACPVTGNEIAVGLQTGQVLVINFITGKTVREYRLTSTLNNTTINTYLSEVRRASNGDLLVATDFAGLITIDKSGVVTSHTHDPIRPGSIAGNNTYRAYGGKKGEVVVGTYTSGLNIGNIYNKSAAYTRIFRDEKGNLFDNYVNAMAEEGNDVFWISGYDRLIRWDRRTKLSTFYYYYYKGPEGLRRLEIRALCISKTGRLIVSALADGLCVFDKATGSLQKIPVDPAQGSAASSGYVYDLLCTPDGTIWAGSNGGIFSVDPVTLKFKGYEQHALLKALTGKRVLKLYEDRQQRLWIGTGYDGVYCYNRKNNTLKHYTDQEGLGSNTIFALAGDTAGNIYAATAAGFSSIAADGRITSYTKKNGLRFDRCEGLLADDNGNIWIANYKCLIRFNPQDGSMEYFEKNAGLSINGFRPGAFLKASNGEMLWGSLSGINYFFPGKLQSAPSQLSLSLQAVKLKDSLLRFADSRSLSFPYSRNGITFYFTAINLNGSRDILYQYRLEGYDKEWHSGIDVREAHYPALPAGAYRFAVRASIDRVNWVTSVNDIDFRVTPPVWKRWWFIAIALLLVVGSLYAVIQNRNRKIRRQREQLETEQAINHFASGMYEQKKVDHILWDVAKNCIGRLHFEDCVIYLIDEERKMLVQKAAHGPKNPGTFEILQPLEIPVGKGIVGHVAATGKAAIIGDTSKDPRYIVDDTVRYSEITVPIVSDGKVLGVIDCEHSAKRFFTDRHLSILTTIASLCANKIIRARAEAEKEQTHLALMETQQKMAEIEMQALRAQMNPHFIFNCLNSINRYIVKSDQATASLYLTRFARLIRLILDNSNSKNVILSNELEALKLYIEMEALRFDKKFSYEIIVADNVPADSIEVPPLIIQPYVENAIWHGLLHMTTVGHLKIHISLPSESMLQCVIEDNGIGRDKARELKSKSATTKKSLGMKLTENRLALLNRHAELNASVEIVDLVKEENIAAGTRVVLNIPI